MKTTTHPSLRSLAPLPQDLLDRLYTMVHRGDSWTEMLQILDHAGFPGYSRKDLEFYVRWGIKTFEHLNDQPAPGLTHPDQEPQSPQ